MRGSFKIDWSPGNEALKLVTKIAIDFKSIAKIFIQYDLKLNKRATKKISYTTEEQLRGVYKLATAPVIS